MVHRSDGSGTTFIFTDYLLEGQPRLEGQGRREHRGQVAGRHRRARATKASPTTSPQTKGSIGYVEYAYAKQNKMTYAKMMNKDGKIVAPTIETFQAAAANADWASKPGYGVILPNQPGDGRLADHGRDLHPDAQAAAGPGRRAARR